MKKPRMIGGKKEPIDILAMELEGDLPYWLSPISKYGDSPQGRAARKKRYQKQWAKRKRKS